MLRIVGCCLVALVVACGSASSADVDASGDATCSCAGNEVCVAGQCVPGNCADGAQNGNETDIDCGGDCLACAEGQVCLSAVDCSSRFCTGGGTCSDCANQADCAAAAGTYCEGGMCRNRNSQGNQCDSANECASGYCVDGVCCDGPCDGACEECSASGVCSFLAAGTDSSGDCTPSEAATCGLSGACDGTGGCAFRGAGDGCDLATCGGGGQGICDGAGACDPNGLVSCDPYVCSGDGENCFTSCSTDDDCVSSHYCDDGGQCQAKLTQGATCAAGNECLTGFCVDSTCCNSDCTGTCKSCTSGTCTNIDGPSAADCGSASPPCGNTGSCNGAGACAKYPSGDPCADQVCSNGQETSARTCDGNGTCSAGDVTGCGGYECNGANCYTSCTGDGQCQSGYGCVGGSCVEQKANGETCSAGSECSSGHCVEGRCCNNACTGTCRSCLASKTDAANGTCANITGGTDPDNECAATAASTCGTTGTCAASGGCAYHGTNVQCTPPSCTESAIARHHPAEYCDGAGTCVSQSTITCGQYGGTRCNGDYCGSGCNCLPAYYCSGNTCVPY